MKFSARTRNIARLLAGAAEIAFRHLNDSHPELKEDRSIVTVADKEIEAYLTQELEDETAGIRVIGEESCASRSAEYLNAALKGKTYIVDPIDGTAVYAHRIPCWGVIIGYAENGRLLEGGVVIPGTGEMLLTQEGSTYYGVSPLPLARWDLEKVMKKLAPPKVEFDDRSLISLPQSIIRNCVFHGPNPLCAFNSSSYSTMLLATGRAAGYFNGAKLWDFGGTLPALKNLGFISIPMKSGDLLNMSMDESNYNHDFYAVNAFQAKGIFLLAPNREIAEKIIKRLGENN